MVLLLGLRSASANRELAQINAPPHERSDPASRLPIDAYQIVTRSIGARNSLSVDVTPKAS
jgi:hypothetical protein